MTAPLLHAYLKVGFVISPVYERNSLHHAVLQNDLDAIQAIKENNHDEKHILSLLMQSDMKGWTPIHLAVYEENIPAFTALLELLKGEQDDRSRRLWTRQILNMEDSFGRTALHMAAEYNRQVKIWDKLLSTFGSNTLKLHGHDKAGFTPFLRAVFRGRQDFVFKLLFQFRHFNLMFDRHSISGENFLHFCARLGHHEILDLLLNAVTERMLNAKDKHGWAPLHYAVASMDDSMISRFLDHPRIHRNITTERGGRNILHIACSEGLADVDTLDMIISSGGGGGEIDTGLVDSNGETPLDIALRKKRYDTMEYLLVKAVPRTAQFTLNVNQAIQSEIMETLFKLPIPVK